MNIKHIMVLRTFMAVGVTALLASCSGGGGGSSSNKDISSATGWKINDKKGGFEYKTDFKKQETGPGLVLIEGGTFTKGKVQDDIMRDWNNTASQQHVQSFYMDETEVTNIMYLEYLDWLKRVFPPDDPSYKNIYYGAIPDTLVWRDRLGYNETMTTNYLRHPAYARYPVVGVNWVQAVEFSKWRTDRVNENILENEGYLKKDAKVVDAQGESTFSTETYINAPTEALGGNAEIVFKGKGNKLDGKEGARNVYAQRSSGILLPEYRLPTESEWEYAALSLGGNREYNLYQGKKKYAWAGPYTRKGKTAKTSGHLANFQQGKGDYGGVAGWSDDGADITAPVKSFPPNDFGLYDMSGNVSEWVADVYRDMVDDEANDFNYYRGSVFMKNEVDEKNKVKVIRKSDIQYDTLSNGKIIARSFPGQLAQVPVDENETYLRNNFSTSDNRNYRDGDPYSMRTYKNADQEQGDKKPRMYDSPIHKISIDSTENKMVRKYDTSSRRNSLVNDDARVYKGGSWRDRAYWLDPAQRRYLPQDMATNDIGFRCAMSRVGAKSDEKNTKGNK